MSKNNKFKNERIIEYKIILLIIEYNYYSINLIEFYIFIILNY